MAFGWRHASPYIAATCAAMRADRPIYLATAAYMVIGAIFVIARSGTLLASLWLYLLVGVAVFGIALPYGAWLAAKARIRVRARRRTALAYRCLLKPGPVGRFAAGTALMLVVLMPFQAMFSSVKSALPVNGQFPDDTLEANADSLLHFGHEPWEYLLGVLHNPVVLRVAEVNYDFAWFVVCFGALYLVAVSPGSNGIRSRYVLCFLLIWIIVGNVIAGTFLTAGPAFYGFVTGDVRRFASLTQFLHTTAGSPYSAADSQSYLWTLHQRGRSGFGSGISAFPSVHVAVVAMNVFFAYERSRRLGLAVTGYMLVILVSSVYLGWHYAIDGYAALALSAGTYWGLRAAWPQLARLRLPSGLRQPAMNDASAARV